MESFKEILKILPLPERLRESVETVGIIRKHWEEFLGRELAGKTEPVRYENGVLVVEVVDFYHLQFLQLMEDDLLRRIRKVINRDIQLKFKINPRVTLKKDKLEEIKEETNQEEIRKKVKGICRSIENEDLKKEFFKLLIRYFRLKKNTL